MLKVDFDRFGLTRHRLMKQLASHGIGSQVHYIPVPMHPYYEKCGFRLEDYPEVKRYYSEALTIPISYGMTDGELRLVSRTIKMLLTT